MPFGIAIAVNNNVAAVMQGNILCFMAPSLLLRRLSKGGLILSWSFLERVTCAASMRYRPFRVNRTLAELWLNWGKYRAQSNLQWSLNWLALVSVRITMPLQRSLCERRDF